MLKRKDGFSGERALVLPVAVIREMEGEPALSMLHITDIGYYPKAWNHFRERQEPISQYVLIYCTEGKGWFRAEGEKYAVEKDQYFILPAHRPHSYGAEEQDPWTIYWVHFKGKLAGEYAGNCLKPTAIRPNTCSRIGERLGLFEEIYHTLEMGYGRENLMYACSVFYHFLGSLRYVQQYRGAVKQENDEGDLVAAAIHYMKENVEKNPLKCEYFLPFVVDELLGEKKATVKVLKSMDKWYGVTYKEDKPVVVAAIQKLKDDGLYPQKLWEEK